MESTAAPSDEQVTTFLRGLRRYRGTLAGPGQILLDSLVTAALARPPDQLLPLRSAACGAPTPAARSAGHGGLDHADGSCRWTTTPWDAVYRGDRLG